MSPAILDRLIAILCRTVPIDQRPRAAKAEGGTLLEDLGIDDLDKVTIACAVDEEWRIEVSDHEMDRWLTVSDIAGTIEHHAQVRA